MKITELYSQRKKKQQGTKDDVYQYDEIPQKLRVQCIFIISDVFEIDDIFYYDVYSKICREYGEFELNGAVKYKSGIRTGEINYFRSLESFFIHYANTDEALDCIELIFNTAENTLSDYSEGFDNEINELNYRFRESATGYQYANGIIIRVDSELIHSEIVKPALIVLNDANFEGAQEEYLSAHEHYRNGKNKEALNDCLKCFESTMKIICKENNWPFSPSITSSKLIDICIQKELIPSYWDQKLKSLSSMLKSSIPTARNKESAHGQGNNVTEVPEHLAAYMLHMTASTILFLYESHKSLDQH